MDSMHYEPIRTDRFHRSAPKGRSRTDAGGHPAGPGSFSGSARSASSDRYSRSGLRSVPLVPACSVGSVRFRLFGPVRFRRFRRAGGFGWSDGLAGSPGLRDFGWWGGRAWFGRFACSPGSGGGWSGRFTWLGGSSPRRCAGRSPTRPAGWALAGPGGPIVWSVHLVRWASARWGPAGSAGSGIRRLGFGWVGGLVTIFVGVVKGGAEAYCREGTLRKVADVRSGVRQLVLRGCHRLRRTE